jgi:hypothetical protein
MTDASATQDNFILPALPVGGLPFSQGWLDRMKLVRKRTVPITLPTRKDILVYIMFKIGIWDTHPDMRQIQGRLGSRICLFIAFNANMAGYPTKHNILFGNR